ncbi:ParB/RepB/Spo0J family partition protein [Streptomyces synnematoformans]|uniref:ParB N-terminal domain-containing protein n=1 Tax=Streptomyces synnematoformans TaxID=415721 RepID=A0ABP5K1L8_9ACTN
MIDTTGGATVRAVLPRERTDRPGGRDRSSELPDATVRIPIAMLRDADSPRLAGIDEDHVRTMAATGAELPPIVVHRATMKVIDGMHRLRVAQLKNQHSVEIHYFDGTEWEAFLLAVELNMRNGLPLTLSDRKQSAMRILQGFPEWSDRAIGVRTGLSGKTVGALRRRYAEHIAQAPVRVGRDGRVRRLTPGRGRPRAAGALPGELARPANEASRPVGVTAPARRAPSAWDQPPPAGGERPYARQPGRCPLGPAVDPVKELESLKRDPALKYSNDGREMIRWLEARIIRKTDPGLVLRAPAHQAKKIADMARACAAQWTTIAMRMDLLSNERS